MDNIQFHLEMGEKLFGARGSLLSLWQEIADNFYPERADFTTIRNVGAEFATNLTTSYPLLARRDLGNAFGAMLRPTSKEWFHIRTTHGWEEIGPEARAWLERARDIQKRAMYRPNTQFTRATNEGDHDFAAFGQCVMQVTMNRNFNGVLYRCWHLRDCAWKEDADGKVTTFYRKWKSSARELVEIFKGKVPPKIAEKAEKDPWCEREVWHCIVPSDLHKGDKQYRTPFVSYYIDIEGKEIIEETGLRVMQYIVPRWQTVSGSQYAYSPATVAALPDARLLQAMTNVLLHAGEKAVDPPMIAVQEAVRSDIAIYAGGVTWVDESFDSKLGEVLRPISQDLQGIPLGLDMARDCRAMLAECFYLNKIALPPPQGEMTAYEVGQRVQEYIRQALPLFAPMEAEYNAPICETTFQLLFHAGAFGSPFDRPEELIGAELEFAFESPLHDAVERQKGQRFLEAKSMIAEAIALDQSSAYIIDAKQALRDVLKAVGVPAKWTRNETTVQQMEQQQQQQMQTEQMLQQMQAGSEVAKTLADAQRVGGGGGVPVQTI